MTTQELKDFISKLLANSATATPQDIAALLAVHPQIVKTAAQLERLSRITRFDEITLTVLSQHGSVKFHSFREDWSCQSSGYGYHCHHLNIREGLFSHDCGAPGAKDSLTLI